MNKFIGRKNELNTLSQLTRKKSASLVVIKGRRRIGKSRLIEEFGKIEDFDHILRFSGLPPVNSTTAQSQRDEFSRQLSLQTGIPEILSDDWNKIFYLLTEKVKSGRTLILLDEISWTGSKDPEFLGKLKNAWDIYFKANPQLILVLCGSISSWIDKNILSNTGFVGRISMDIFLEPLPLEDCQYFWGKQCEQISPYEKLKVLSVTGGIPLYLEHIDPRISAEENIKRLCFLPHGLLFEEFERIFSDLFSKRSSIYRKILITLLDGPKQQTDLLTALKIQQSGVITEYTDELEKAGFITRDFTWNLKSGKISNLSNFRLSDNYTRFYLKQIFPNQIRIKDSLFKNVNLTNLKNFNTLMGLQFENLVLNNRHKIWQKLNINPQDIIFNNPYLQRKTIRHKGCQIDYLIQLQQNTIYIIEIKFSKHKIGLEVIQQMKDKITALAIPQHFSYRPVLIQVNGVTDDLEDEGYFAEVINFGDFFNIN